MSNFDYLKPLSEDELKKLTTEENHSYMESDEDEDTWGNSDYHSYWDCEACEAENELAHRQAAREAKLPGANTARYIPGVQTATHKSIDANELKVGMVAAYIARPGRGKYPTDYVECVSAEVSAEGVTATWHTTNLPPDEGATFTVTYEADEYIDVGYTTPLKGK